MTDNIGLKSKAFENSLEKKMSPHNHQGREQAMKILKYTEKEMQQDIQGYEYRKRMGEVKEVPNDLSKKWQLPVYELSGNLVESSAGSIKPYPKGERDSCFSVKFSTHWDLRNALEKGRNSVALDIEIKNILKTSPSGPWDKQAIRNNFLKAAQKDFGANAIPEFVDKMLSADEGSEQDVKKSIKKIYFFGAKFLPQNCGTQPEVCRNLLLAHQIHEKILGPGVVFRGLHFCTVPWIESAFTDALLEALHVVPVQDIKLVDKIEPSNFVVAISTWIPIRTIIADLPLEERPRMLLTESIDLEEKNFDDIVNDKNSVRIQNMAKEYDIKKELPNGVFRGLTLYVRTK